MKEIKWMFFGSKRSGHHVILDWLLSGENFIHYNNSRISMGKLASDEILGRSGDIAATFEVALTHYDWKVFNCNKYLILRNPYNMYASRLAMKRANNDESWDTCLDPNRWLECAREFIGETNLLGEFIKINYDKWFTSISYRSKFRHNGNCEFVPHFGGGSSFDQMKFDGCGSKMDVLNRWKLFQNDSEFQDILNNREISELVKQIGFPVKVTPSKLIF